MNVEFRGANGYGEAIVTIDKITLVSDLAKLTKVKVVPRTVVEGNSNNKDLENVLKAILVEVKNNGSFSNGDEVEIDLHYNADFLDKQRVKLIPANIKKKVEGLIEAEAVDPFKGLTFNFEGIAPQGIVKYEYNNSDARIKISDFSFDKVEALKNGDVITARVNIEDSTTLERGFILTQKEKQFTVEGLGEYITSIEDLSTEELAFLEQEASDYASSELASLDSVIKSGKAEYQGYIFGSKKEGADTNQNNIFYFIYKTFFTNIEDSFKQNLYYPVAMSNVYRVADGIKINSEINIISEERYRVIGAQSVNAYKSPYTLLNTAQEGLKSEYDVIASKELKVFENETYINNLNDIKPAFL